MNKALGSRSDIQEFLDHRRLALVGVSRDKRDFTRSVLHELEVRGYDVYPVNPHVNEIDGHRCFASVGEISPRVDGAIVMTSADVTESVVRDCAAAGVTRVWMHRGGGAGAVSEAAIAVCRQSGIRTIAGQCPLMFLPNGSGIHKVHALFKRLFGSYPGKAS